MIFDQVIAFLKTRSAEQIAHVNGTLLAHLEGTCALLLGWGNPIDLCLAGLCHTIYGTDGFPVQLLDISQRWELKRMIGPQAEEFVYFYASCDRSYLYPQIKITSPIQFRDRFTGSIFVPDDSLLKSFLELTFANELELAQSDPVLVDQTRTAIAPLFSRCQGLVSDSAFAYFFDVYEVSDR
ncbi:MAG: hypothetical protein DMF76_01850 [Acidobacteria bacterium]|nr:MAG: hypothetical protein DMF76_01850 [Acidobacteriota bacterium]